MEWQSAMRSKRRGSVWLETHPGLHPFLLMAVLQPKAKARQALAPRLRLAENKNASSDAHSDSSDSRSDAASFCN